MLPEPIYYEFGDPEEDGHSHLFRVTDNSFETAESKDESEPWMHKHMLGLVGDDLYCSPASEAVNQHIHEKVRMVRPIG